MKMKIILLLLSFTTVILSYGQDINKGIIGYWNFETLDGGSINNKGSLINATLTATDFNNKALKLNGKDSYLQINNGIDLFNHFSIAFWINFSKLEKECTIIDQFNSNGRFFKLNVDSTNIILSCSDEFKNQNTVYSNNYKIKEGKWHFISVIAKNANLTVQIDSTKVIQIDNLNLNIREKQINDSLSFGTLSSENDIFSFNGLIDELVVYNRAISEIERNILFSKKLPEPVTELKTAPVINGRETKVFAKYTTSEPKIRIEYYDKDKVDNDRITIYFNGKAIVEDEVLTKEKKEISFTIEPYKNNYLTLFANNLGDYPPNTASVLVFINGKQHELSLKSDYNKNATLQFVYIPKND